VKPSASPQTLLNVSIRSIVTETAAPPAQADN
jgi:hypothetical protein